MNIALDESASPEKRVLDNMDELVKEQRRQWGIVRVMSARNENCIHERDPFHFSEIDRGWDS